MFTSVDVAAKKIYRWWKGWTKIEIDMLLILQIQILVHYLRFVIISAFLLLPHFQSASLNHNTLQSSTVHDSIDKGLPQMQVCTVQVAVKPMAISSVDRYIVDDTNE